MPDGRRAFRVPREDEVLVAISAGVQLRIVRFIAPSSSIEDNSFRPGHQFWLHFETAQRVCDVADWWIPWVTGLMSLLVGDPVTCTKVELFIEDPYAPDQKGLPNPGNLTRRGNNGGSKRKYVHRLAMLARTRALRRTLKVLLEIGSGSLQNSNRWLICSRWGHSTATFTHKQSFCS